MLEAFGRAKPVEYATQGTFDTFWTVGETMTKHSLEGIDRDVKPVLKVGTRTAQCASCSAFFTGVAPFDRHMVGAEDGDLECLDADGMRAIGMRQNKYGTWQYGLPLKVAQAA